MDAPFNTAMIRRMNTARVFEALQRSTLPSQRELRAITGLDKATISAVVSDLEQSGMVERVARPGQRRVGRPEVGLRIPESAGVFVGVRVEVTSIRAMVTTLDGLILQSLEWSGSRDFETAIERIVGCVRAALAEAGRDEDDCRGIGIGVPALMDANGRVAFAPNLGWRDAPLGERLAAAFRAPVLLDNDTKAAALAERRFGACRDVRHFLFITGHSGVGGGLFLNGELYRGSAGHAGEIGHVKVVENGRACGCGGFGCLEAYVSEQSIVAQLAERNITVADAREAGHLADQGNATVHALLDEAARHLGFAISNVLHVLNPERVVLAGNLAPLGGHLMPRLEAWIERNTMTLLNNETRVLISPLGPDAVPMGGVALALDAFLAEGVGHNGGTVHE